MFEISQLKEKTLVELQEIAKTVGAKKFSHLKKLDLVYLILDIQATAPIKVTSEVTQSKDNKPKRKRLVKKVSTAKKPTIASTPSIEAKVATPVNVDQDEEVKPLNPNQNKPI